MPAVGQGWTDTEMEMLFDFVSRRIAPGGEGDGGGEEGDDGG